VKSGKLTGWREGGANRKRIRKNVEKSGKMEIWNPCRNI